MARCVERLAELNAAGRHVCVGLDPDPSRLPSSVEGATDAERVVAFNTAIVEATADFVCAYKPNAAFYEALGKDSFWALSQTIAAAHRIAPEVPVILDAKRADIGSTNTGYVAAIFDELGADATTVHPYLGGEALAPFLEREEAAIFVLARTSNPGAGEFQNLESDGLQLYRHVARAVATRWNRRGNCGLVVGATYPTELAQIRADVPSNMPILIPGIGAQGGDLAAIVAAERAAGSSSFLISASRSVIYASSGEDYAEAAWGAGMAIHETVTKLIASHGTAV